MKKSNIVFSILFVAILIMGGILTLLNNKSFFSFTENRYLALFPNFDFYNFKEGKYMLDLENYVNDHLIGRENLIKLKNKVQYYMGKRDIQDVYIGKNDYLFEKVTSDNFNFNRLKENIEIVNEFSQKYKNTKFLLVPSKGYIYDEYLPSFATYIEEKEIFDYIKEMNINFIDVTDIFFQRKSEKLYYKTDHHWTTLGAFYVYNYIFNNSKIDDYNWVEVSDSFKGTLDSKIIGLNKISDSIYLAQNKKLLNDFIVNSNSYLYDWEKLKNKNQYDFFLGGNTDEVYFETNNKNGKSILIFKDSFANSFVSFILNDYQFVYIIDLRYFNGNVLDYIKEKNPTDILILYGLNNFSDDIGLLKLQNIK